MLSPSICTDTPITPLAGMLQTLWQVKWHFTALTESRGNGPMHFFRGEKEYAIINSFGLETQTFVMSISISAH